MWSSRSTYSYSFFFFLKRQDNIEIKKTSCVKLERLQNSHGKLKFSTNDNKTKNRSSIKQLLYHQKFESPFLLIEETTINSPVLQLPLHLKHLVHMGRASLLRISLPTAIINSWFINTLRFGHQYFGTYGSVFYGSRIHTSVIYCSVHLHLLNFIYVIKSLNSIDIVT